MTTLCNNALYMTSGGLGGKEQDMGAQCPPSDVKRARRQVRGAGPAICARFELLRCM